jgi:hypothetical protein
MCKSKNQYVLGEFLRRCNLRRVTDALPLRFFVQWTQIPQYTVEAPLAKFQSDARDFSGAPRCLNRIGSYVIGKLKGIGPLGAFVQLFPLDHAVSLFSCYPRNGAVLIRPLWNMGLGPDSPPRPRTHRHVWRSESAEFGAMTTGLTTNP